MIEKLKEKYVFFDVDGTLFEYRYKDSTLVLLQNNYEG